MREQLIAGQLTRAEQAEEIVLLRNELAVTRKKLAKLESHDEVGKDSRGRSEAAVPEWAETNGHGAVFAGAQEAHVSGCDTSGCGFVDHQSLWLDYEGIVSESTAEHFLWPPAGGVRQTFPSTKSGEHRKGAQFL